MTNDKGLIFHFSRNQFRRFGYERRQLLSSQRHCVVSISAVGTSRASDGAGRSVTLRITARLAASSFGRHITGTLAHVQQLFNRFRRQFVRSSHQPSYERYLREVLKRFHPRKSGFQIRPIRDSAVIGEQQGIVMWNERRQRLRQFFRRWSAVTGQGHTAQRKNDFR